MHLAVRACCGVARSRGHSRGHGSANLCPCPRCGCQVFDICYALRFWLSWNPKGVAVLFDSTVNTVRSGFVLACFLAYQRMQSSTVEAFEHFAARRYPDNPSAWLCVRMCVWLCVPLSSSAPLPSRPFLGSPKSTSQGSSLLLLQLSCCVCVRMCARVYFARLFCC
jgi:hypothetical protein